MKILLWVYFCVLLQRGVFQMCLDILDFSALEEMLKRHDTSGPVILQIFRQFNFNFCMV